MNALRFETEISKEGLIQIPLNKKFFGKKVDILIIPKKNKSKDKITPQEFIKKWSGFLSNDIDDNIKYDYLMEKYK
jgi:hypothetical protein